MAAIINYVLKSALQGLFGGFFGSVAFFALKTVLFSTSLFGSFVPVISLGIIGILAFFGLKYFFNHAAYSTIAEYLSFGSGAGVGGIIGWIVWGMKTFL